MTILIATPTHDGRIDRETYHSVLGLLAATMERGMRGVRVETKIATLVDRARNLFASRVLNDATLTHLLFVDADMGFRAEAVLRMLELDKPVVGALYPTRLGPLKFVGAQAVLPGHAPLNGFVRVSHAGTGLMLIQRKVFEMLRDAYPQIYLSQGTNHFRDEGLTGPVLQAFAPLVDQHNVVMSEDVSFCSRWTAIGGEIWAATDEHIAHAGRQVVRARYNDTSAKER